VPDTIASVSVGSPSPGGRWIDRIPTVSPKAFRRLSIASLAAVCLIVATGAAVRLTGSGLGCPDWPSCYRRQITPQLSFHPLVEFSNRLVTVVLIVLVAAVFLAAVRRQPFRGDLTWLTLGLLAGVLAQAAIGALAVYTKLNPYVVLCHFLASMVLVADAVVLVHRSGRDHGAGSGQRLVPPAIILGGRVVLGLLTIVLVAGSFTTGAGPHAGSSSGQLVAKRIPIALRDMAELHSSLALLLVGVCVGLAVALHAMAVPERVRRGARMLCGVLFLQAAVGYTQYFTRLPAALVEVHVIGATVLVLGAVQFVLSLTDHPPERVLTAAPDDEERAAFPPRVQVGG
jgi:heme a synthase